MYNMEGTGQGTSAGPKEARQARPGQDLLVAGPVGQLGTRILAAAYREQLTGWFSKSYSRKLEDTREPEVAPYIGQLRKQGAATIMAVGEGGILRAIWDASAAWGVGVAFSLRRIPIGQGTVELSERCGCNPYRLWCGNCLLLTADNGGRLAEACGAWQITAAVIGTVEAGAARKICHGEVTGYLERPREDEVVRLLGRERAQQLLSMTGLPVT